MSAKALASPIIGHRGHPGGAERRHLMQHKNLLCSFTLSAYPTGKTACARLKCDARPAPWQSQLPIRVVFPCKIS